MNSINMTNVSKEFKRYKKQEGLLNNFFNRTYETKYAVKDFNMDVKEGEIVGLLGQNGAGKTTVMKMLSGLIMPTNGNIKVLQQDPFEKKNEFKKQISLVMGQKQQLWWDVSPRDNFELNRSIYGIKESLYKKRLDEFNEILELEKFIDSPVRTLSLGERMKCELVVALLHHPQILFLDEPTIGLDILMQKKTRDFIKLYNQKYKATILITSHYMKDIEELCDRIIFINTGKKHYDGTLNDFMQLYGNMSVLNIELVKTETSLELSQFGEIISSNGNKRKIKVPKNDVNEIRKKVLLHEDVAIVVINEMDAGEIVRTYFEKEMN